MKLKKKIVSLLMALALTLAFTTVTFAQRDVKVFVGGTDIEPDVAPIIIEGRVMLPVRAVFEAIKAKVSYDAAERKVTAIKKDITVEFVIDSKVMTINGEEKEIDVPATIVNGRTLVPLRACAEAFNLDVAWNGDRYIAKVKYPVALVSETVLPNSDIVHKYTYDENGYEASWTNSVDSSSKTTFDEDGNLLYVEQQYSNYVYWVKNEFDKYGNLVCTENNSGTFEKYIYDEQHRLIRKEGRDGILYTAYTYNADGKIAREDYGEGTSRIYTYDANGNAYVDGGNGYWEKLTYNANGDLLTQITSDEEMFEINEYDSAGRLIKNTIAAYGMEETWEYGYDENGRIIYTNNPGGITKYTYNEFGDILTEEMDGNIKTYKYDEDGKLLWEGYSEDSGTTYTYDENGNLISSESSYGEITKYITVVR